VPNVIEGRKHPNVLLYLRPSAMAPQDGTQGADFEVDGLWCCSSVLIRLDQGFFYGTGLDLPVKDHFSKAGRYSIRVIYKSWLRKEFVAPQLRDLPALWADTPQIASEPVWIDVTQ
jgi:hypothetical protein